MARLSAAARSQLPDRAFAYVDSRGRRRLPIADAAHVRNALARFNQVEFESDAAREEARTRLLRAAKRFRIVPIGFISSQLRTERELGGSAATRPELPTGFVTLLMTDIEGSTPLVHRLGDRYEALLRHVRGLQTRAVELVGGVVVDARADELFAVFDCPRAAVEAAVGTQRDLGSFRFDGEEPVSVRIGIHAGYPTLSDGNYIGLAVHTTARIATAAHGGQIVISSDARTALTGMTPPEVRLRNLGTHRLRGIPEPVPLFQVAAPGLRTRFPALRL
jgi:class 3 adenylate cyclase